MPPARRIAKDPVTFTELARSKPGRTGYTIEYQCDQHSRLTVRTHFTNRGIFSQFFVKGSERTQGYDKLGPALFEAKQKQKVRRIGGKNQ